jgi:hypothetical protein
MTRGRWRLVWYGLVTVLFVQLVVLQILAFGKNFPLLMRVGICDAIVLAIFLLSDHRRRRFRRVLQGRNDRNRSN